MIDFAKLRAPFPAADVRWKPTAKNENAGKALAVAYLTARAIQDRLDEVCGPENWQVSYVGGPAGGIVAKLAIQVEPGNWITKEDGAENTEIEPVKGGISGALRRAGSAWGIGRYLYDLPSKWVDAEFHGRAIRLRQTPKLPAWALPKGETAQPTSTFDPDTGEIFDGDGPPADTPAQAPAAPDESVVTTTVAPADEPAATAPSSRAASEKDPFLRFTTLMADYHVTSRPVADFLGVPFSRNAILSRFHDHPDETPESLMDAIRRKAANAERKAS